MAAWNWNWNLEADGFAIEERIEQPKDRSFEIFMAALTVGAGMIIAGEIVFVAWATFQSAGLPVWVGVVIGMVTGVVVTVGLRMIADRHYAWICKRLGIFEA